MAYGTKESDVVASLGRAPSSGEGLLLRAALIAAFGRSTAAVKREYGTTLAFHTAEEHAEIQRRLLFDMTEAYVKSGMSVLQYQTLRDAHLPHVAFMNGFEVLRPYNSPGAADGDMLSLLACSG